MQARAVTRCASRLSAALGLASPSCGRRPNGLPLMPAEEMRRRTIRGVGESSNGEPSTDVEGPHATAVDAAAAAMAGASCCFSAIDEASTRRRSCSRRCANAACVSSSRSSAGDDRRDETAAVVATPIAPPMAAVSISRSASCGRACRLRAMVAMVAADDLLWLKPESSAEWCASVMGLRTDADADVDEDDESAPAEGQSALRTRWGESSSACGRCSSAASGNGSKELRAAAAPEPLEAPSALRALFPVPTPLPPGGRPIDAAVGLNVAVLPPTVTADSASPMLVVCVCVGDVGGASAMTRLIPMSVDEAERASGRRDSGVTARESAAAPSPSGLAGGEGAELSDVSAAASVEAGSTAEAAATCSCPTHTPAAGGAAAPPLRGETRAAPPRLLCVSSTTPPSTTIGLLAALLLPAPAAVLVRDIEEFGPRGDPSSESLSRGDTEPC